MDTFPVETKFDRSTDYDVSLRGLRAGYGGVEETAPDGINPDQQEWRVETIDLDAAAFANVRAFLRNQAGRSFLWQLPPSDAQADPQPEPETIKVICSGYRVRYVGGGGVYKRISATFTQTR